MNNNLTSTVIICTRNRITDILTFLDSLAQQTAQPTEIIIVDSSDIKITEDPLFSQKFTPHYFAQSKLIYTHTAPGLTYQRNQGITLATGDVMYFFDDDVKLAPDYVQNMQSIFAQNPHYGGGMGTISNIEPTRFTFFRLMRILFLLQRDASSGNFTYSGMPTHPYGKHDFKTVQVLGGCCMAFRSWVFDKHQFDENLRFYGYMEDCDFSRRVSRDFPLFYNPQAQLEHHNSPLNRDKVVDNRAMFMRNYRYLYFKNFYSKNKFTLIAHYWSILGLFVEALFVLRNKNYLVGYIKGLFLSPF